MTFFDELKRRNVIRVGAAYLLVAWLILQVVDVVGPMLELPVSFGRGVLLLLAIGFALALLFSWIYELTPEGLKREKDVDRSESITHATGRKLNVAIVGLLLVAVVIFGVDRFVGVGPDSSISDVDESDAATQDGPIRIAVLPFVNMSDDPDQEYFSDGLSEELLNLLSRIPDLSVTSRTSAFSFRGEDFTIADVGEQLNVDHVLEGSVRRSGDTIRITAQLVHVAKDEREWSDTWDRQFEDVFVIQDEIAGHVVDALKIELLDDIPTVEETTPQVYALVLEASYMRRQGNAPGFRQAIALLERAVELDPNYSPAWSQLAWAHYGGTSRGVGDKHDVMPTVRAAIDKALQLNPSSVDAYAARAQVAWSYDYDYETASRSLEIAEELEPWNAQLQRQASSWAYGMGNAQLAVDHIERAHELDPLAGHRKRGAVSYYFAGYVEQALQFLEQRATENPYGERRYSDWARVVLMEGDPEGALALLNNEASDGHQAANRALVFQTTGDYDKAQEELDRLIALGIRWTFEIAEVYAYMGNADEAFAWLDRAIERRDSSLNQTVLNPFVDPIRDDPRYDELLERLGRKPTLLPGTIN